MWLPYAMADLLSAILASRGGNPPRLADILNSWGLTTLADRFEEAETDNALDALADIAKGTQDG